MGLGKPRTNPYHKVLSRLSEFLALFYLVKRAEGPPVITNHDPSSLQATRRRFLKNLCFICDYKKGGDTTTSIAVEDQPDCFKFWVAANVAPDPKVIAFLNSILDSLRDAGTLDGGQRQTLKDTLTRESIRFAIPRLKKECKMLSRAAKKAKASLEGGLIRDLIDEDKLMELKAWLPQFHCNTDTDILPLCQSAYRARNDPQMRTLQDLSHEDAIQSELAKSFRMVRHFVGRLAEHIRVPGLLVEDAARLESLLDVYRVAPVEAPTPATVPLPDGLTNLKSITKRMLKADDPRLDDFQHYLSNLDQQTGLEARVRDMYGGEDTKPRVHAELQMLEFFHRSGRAFVDNDRYVACSKLACLCCKLYFRHHPGRFVEPDSHQKAYTNWRPILLPQGDKDRLFREQRAILANVSKDISGMVENQIALQQSNVISQQDSVTNITGSVDYSFESSDFEDESVNEDEVQSADEAPSTQAVLNENGDSSDSDGESDGGAAL
ncbi:hypothetical protein ACJ41O_013340 [Fusarium nematophilum]